MLRLLEVLSFNAEVRAFTPEKSLVLLGRTTASVDLLIGHGVITPNVYVMLTLL